MEILLVLPRGRYPEQTETEKLIDSVIEEAGGQAPGHEIPDLATRVALDPWVLNASLISTLIPQDESRCILTTMDGQSALIELSLEACREQINEQQLKALAKLETVLEAARIAVALGLSGVAGQNAPEEVSEGATKRKGRKQATTASKQGGTK